MDSLDDIKSSDPYVYWIHLWETYGDPHIPPFSKDLIPPVAVASSPDEITPLDAPIDPILATDASDLVQQDPLCLPTLPPCDNFLSTITSLLAESHIEDVEDTIDDIHLLFEANTSFIVAVTNSCTSTQQGTFCLLVPASGDDFLTDILGFFMESHTIDLEDFFDDLLLLFAKDDPSTVVLVFEFFDLG